jgi:uncharacterized protein
MIYVALVTVVFLAAMLQVLSGFGFALIVMPLATLLLDLHTAAPLVALISLTVYTINLIRYRQAINIREVLHLAMASALGVPVGIWVLANVDEILVNRLLGLILIAYGAYSLLRPLASRLPSRRWVYPAGFLAGCLGGAYNTPGPPVIVYGTLRQWPKDEFRAVLQAFFFVNGLLVVTSHLVAHHVTAQVLAFYLYAAPALVLGILLGSRLDAKVDRERFRLLVTAMILIVGLALLLGVA